jgi:lysophospholipase
MIVIFYLSPTEYDAFIILHGTDTLSYTASALSFMIENLQKTVIITGAQVPMGEIRNDAVNNLLCALTIAGHYIIPEVLVVFDNNVMRGNRTTKTSASTFDSFRSPNFRPLGHLGIKI